MPRLPTIGGDNNNWGDVLNEYLSVSLDTDGAIKDSALNLKTINSTSLIGSGDMTVQPTLVSGTTIKTINSTSLLGSGDIVITGGGSSAILITTFIGNILLDKLEGRDYGVNHITTNNEITLDNTDLKDGAWAQIGLVGDGSHTPLLSAFNKWDANGYDYLNTSEMVNVFVFSRIMQKLYWNIIDQYTIATPTLVSIGTSSNGLTVSFEFSRDMANPASQANLFSFSPNKTIVSASLRAGNAKIIDVAVSVAFSVVDIITTTVESGLLPDGFGDAYTGGTNHAVTNNVTNVAITNLTNLTRSGIRYTAQGTSPARGYGDKLLPGEFAEMVYINQSSGSGIVLGLSTTQSAKTYTSFDYAFHYYVASGGQASAMTPDSAYSSVNNIVITRYRIKRSIGNLITIEYSIDNGANYVLRKEYQDTSRDLYLVCDWAVAYTSSYYIDIYKGQL
jgi:hypothetical protein